MKLLPDIDENLVKRAREMDQDAIAQIVEIIHKPCYTMVYRCLESDMKHMNEINDLLQQAYIKAFSHLNQLKNDDGFSPWFYRILDNTIIDFLNSAHARNKPIEFSQLENDEFNETFESMIENKYEEFHPQANVDYSVLKDGINDCLRKLPEKQSSALYMYYFQGKKIDEIAKIYGVPSNTVKSWLRRGLANVSNIVEKLRKTDKSFYSIVPIPFLVWLLGNELDTEVKAQEIAQVITTATKTVVATKTTSTLIKAFLKTAQGKAVAVTAAVAISVTGVYVYNAVTNQEEIKPEEVVQTIKKETKQQLEPDSKEETKDDSHTHDWKAQYKTVHHDAITHQEQVLVQAAYDEAVYTTVSTTKYNANGRLFDTLEEAQAYVLSFGTGDVVPVTTTQQVQTGAIHHDAVYQTQTVTDQEAYDEQVITGYICSSCNQTKEK